MHSVSHQEISKGSKAIAAFVSGPVRAFRYLPRGLVFPRVYRLPRALVNSRDYSLAYAPPQRQPLGIVAVPSLIKPAAIRYRTGHVDSLRNLETYETKFNTRAIQTEIIIIIKVPLIKRAG